MSLPFDQNVLQLQTAEGHRLRLPLAGPMTRFIAWSIDLIATLAINAVLFGFLATFSLLSPDFSTALRIVLAFAVYLGYGIVLEWAWRGQTIGKHLMGIRVLDANGLRLTVGQVVMRNIMRLVDALPALYAVGGVAVVLSPKRQRLGDLVANTIVVRRRETTPPDFAALMPDKYNSFRDHPHLEARLRQHLQPEAVALVVQALLRRSELEPKDRVAFYADLVAWLQQQVPFPDAAVHGITDEQYLRNVLDSLYRRTLSARATAAERNA